MTETGGIEEGLANGQIADGWLNVVNWCNDNSYNLAMSMQFISKELIQRRTALDNLFKF